MYSKEIHNLAHSAEVKINLLKRSKSRYIVSAMLGSLFVSLGIMLIYSIGGIMHHGGSPFYKITMGVSFGVALSLVLMAGGDLFTSNSMIMTMGALEKTVTWVDAIQIWFASWFGNILGGVVGAVLFVQAGLASGKSDYIGEFIVSNVAAKINTPFMPLLIKGILCNILVCLAVWMCYKLKEETAKILMIFWCLFTFITAGFEHSVANMGLLAMGVMLDPGTITIGGYMYNIIVVSLGNFIGGVVFLALPYYYITSNNKK
ncbi:formate/nitrite transporter family protein [Clostridium chauvoei]|uniref:Formate/nitrite transporter family protein n=2 Tax=Clostridium chauvoei TaxID=46867 RepID=A0ABD4RIK9_9CLOT|nr:formate/nitrite transporter family protein [Clostridium chauvoei]ATD54534.1 nitrite transporter NirC [Clostridium chauvoei]ATD57784.1 nitrite transporter NirC [Clostridium chauvoei]MBX7281085.1 formate/nitrite transporter family protein [Clostridium chauvoei]MBX7283528.1 formate/nitrite transporter family protein [Clostridium chauvoei]MBX7286058.1 formate/nitrite transporter family protein [Clostridium chauvoei]